jgi:hypothetical protein
LDQGNVIASQDREIRELHEKLRAAYEVARRASGIAKKVQME